jgi:signal peptidase I
VSRRSHQTPFDFRIALYRTVRTIVIAAGAVAAVKFALFDSVAVQGDQMAPTILSGDRLLLLRTPLLPKIRDIAGPRIDCPVVFRSISSPGYSDCLRSAAAAGDTISIDSGTVLSTGDLRKTPLFNRPKTEIIPRSFAPRDFFAPLRVPAKDDVLFFNRLSLRDFFFARSIITQEHPKSAVTFKPYVMLDDSACSDYIIKDFTMYTGSIDSVPDSLRNDWFFWNRVDEFLREQHSGRRVSLYFTLSLDNTVLDEYRVSDDYYFMIADDRSAGLDSRIIGPIGRSRCTGVPVMVLWSIGTDEHGKRHLRFKRLGRFIS